MHRRCQPVTDFDAKLLELIADLTVTMDAADGAGLAANQIGVDLRVFVYRCADADEVIQEGAVCNPVLELPTGTDRHLDEGDEGCLSLPGAYALCARPDVAVVRGADPHGSPLVVRGTGLLARCLQHETDHLDGIVFGDRLSKRTRRKLYEEAEEMADEFGPTWPAG